MAEDPLRRGVAGDTLRIPQQAILELVSATTRSQPDGHRILDPADARREAEELLSIFRVLYPNEAIVRTAIRGAAAYGLPWFDAHLWAYAEYHGLAEILSEDFQDGRLYGSVRAMNPFAAAG